MKTPNRILIMGQVPPPYHGQAMMTERLLNGDLPEVEMYFLRMDFSQSLDAVGKASVRKLWHLVELVVRAIRMRFHHQLSTLYFMPAGNATVPLIRDMLLLGLIRPFFPKLIFHFRAAGIGEYVDQLPFLFKRLAWWVYGKPELAIHLTHHSPDDGGYFAAKRTVVIHNGLEDGAETYLPIQRESRKRTRILLLSSLKASKGVMILLEAVAQLRDRGYQLDVHCVGPFASAAFEQTCRDFCESNALTSLVHFPGVKLAEEKWQEYLWADIFCFPSYFESESAPSVVLEAGMFELPVVSTQWRGIPSLVEHGGGGFLVPPQSVEAIYQALEELILDPQLRAEMGQAGRRKYLQEFQLAIFYQQMNAALSLSPHIAKQEIAYVH
ncbi:MAG: glycosyltransferase family 4 protein [Bacteroidota bacterium]